MGHGRGGGRVRGATGGSDPAPPDGALPGQRRVVSGLGRTLRSPHNAVTVTHEGVAGRGAPG